MTEPRSVDSRSARARTQMMDAAERIVATKGLDALTLRDVQDAAGQRNKSAATYHFGSREGLIGATLLRLVTDLNTRREELIRSVGIPLVEMSRNQLVEMMIAPHLDGVLRKQQSYEARFIQQCSMHPSLINLMRHRGQHPNILSVRQHLTERLEHLSPASRVIRLDYVMSLVVSWTAQYEAFREVAVMLPVPPAIAREDLLNVCIAMVNCEPDAASQIDENWHTSYTRTWRLDETNDQIHAVRSRND